MVLGHLLSMEFDSKLYIGSVCGLVCHQQIVDVSVSGGGWL